MIKKGPRWRQGYEPDLFCTDIEPAFWAAVSGASNIALIRSIWTSVSFDRSPYERLTRGLLSFAAMLFKRFLRSSNILRDTHSVSSIFSLWMVRRASAVKEWPV